MEEMEMTMNGTVACADDILEELCDDKYSVEMEVGLLKTFVIYASNWVGTGTAEVVPGLGSLLLDIQATVMHGMRDIEPVQEQRALSPASSTQRRDAVITKVQEKITLVGPQVKAAYERLIIISSHDHNSNNRNNYHLWMESLQRNLADLSHASPVKTYLCAVCEMLQNLGYCRRSHPSEYTFLRTHFEALLVRAARFSYTCWVDTITSDGPSIATTTKKIFHMLLHLLNEFKPNTPQLIQVCLKLLNESSVWVKKWVQNLVDFLIPEQGDVAILRHGLKNPILFLNCGPNLYKEDEAAHALSNGYHISTH